MITTGTEQGLQCALIQRSANSYLPLDCILISSRKKVSFCA